MDFLVWELLKNTCSLVLETSLPHHTSLEEKLSSHLLSTLLLS